MKNIIKLSIITTCLITIFIGCGDGDANFSDPETTLTITKCDTYTTLLTNDVVISDNTTATEIKTVVNTDDTKKICVVTGSAHILRKD